MNYIHKFKLILVIVLFNIGSMVFAQDAPNGEKLFKSNCASCHNKNMKDPMTGPALSGVQDRWEDQEELYAWIRNSQVLVEAGNPYAVSLYNEWNKSVMTAFPTLKDEEIAALLIYVDDVATGKIGGAVVVDAGNECVSIEEEAAASAGEGPNMMLLFAFALILIVLAFVLSRLISALDRISAAKDGGEVTVPPTVMEQIFNKKVIGAVIFAVVLIGGYYTVNNAINLGRSQGYKPEQPIKFSHKIHACENDIECQYCHIGANKGKTAVIPSTNVCMNCHAAISEGTTTGKEEIAKIYEAADYDPATKTYGSNPKDVEWVKIHNLPDHVYFNHSQHVNAGQIACQDCHGEVERMDVVQQHAPLSMGWCINCHRQTEVQFTSNDYYSVYEKYHDDLKNGKISKVTVKDIGGLECQKCHY